MLKTTVCASAVLAVTLAACGAPRPRPPTPREALQLEQKPPALAAVGVYRIDAGRSELRVLVYRAGPMARFGHNHVMTNRAISGSVTVADTLSSSVFSLSVPAAEFVVDDAEMRREEGADFEGDIAPDAKDGTLRNMLSPSLLDAAEFPSILVRSVAVDDSHGALTATLSIQIAGHESTVMAPFTLEVDSGRLSAWGSVDLRQTELGLTPFSLMLGVLKVQDEIHMKFRIVATSS